MGYITYFVLFVCAALSNDVISARRLLNTENGRIVGGTKVDIQNAPYMAYLVLTDGSNFYQCGGSIISTRHILTAAHCLKDIVNVSARIGSSSAFSGGRTYTSTFFVKHPQYNMRTKEYDVAYIRFTQNLNLDGTNAAKVTLVEGGGIIPENTMMNITGWGATSEGGANSMVLMGTTVPTLTNPGCRNLTRRQDISERVLCAGLPQGGKDACQGDSGGPGVSRGVQIGIVSSGFGCARPNNPGFYTNITNNSIRTWIRMNTGV